VPNTFDQDTYFTGNAYFTGPTVQLPNGSIGDAQHGTGSPVTAAKLEHQYQPTFQQPTGQRRRANAERCTAPGTSEPSSPSWPVRSFRTSGPRP
jgi:hypothetical protein